ncbi:uncharacterized protein TNCV_3496951 [Trichonephila clavipes]|nr:uncharacterized protein TNCV_3496951 [Trichonephila clavipes]
MEEVILRYGLLRRLISDHGSQFVGAVMQQLSFILNIDKDVIPVYHPQANPVERKNRDLKPRIAILQGEATMHGSPIRSIFSTRVGITRSTTGASSKVRFSAVSEKLINRNSSCVHMRFTLAKIQRACSAAVRALLRKRGIVGSNPAGEFDFYF